MKAQLSLEYLIIFSALLAVLAVLVPEYSKVLTNSQNAIREARQSSFSKSFNLFIKYCELSGENGFLQEEFVFPKKFELPETVVSKGVFEGKKSVSCTNQKGSLIVESY